MLMSASHTVHSLLTGPLITDLLGLGRTSNSKLVENTANKQQESRENGANACVVDPHKYFRFARVVQSRVDLQYMLMLIRAIKAVQEGSTVGQA